MGVPSAYIDDQFFGSGFADQGSIDLDCNLLWYYALEAESGTREDVGPNSLNLSETGSVTFDTGIITNAAQFPGTTGNFLSHGFDSVYDFSSTDFTLTGWFKLEDNSVDRIILYMGTSDFSPLNFSVLISYSAGLDRICFEMSDGSLAIISKDDIGGTIPTGQFIFFVMRWNTVTERLETRLNSQPYKLFDILQQPQSLGTESFVLGATLSQTLPWDGLIDEVGGWDRQLNNLEINFLYNGGAGNRPDLIVTHLGVPVTFEGVQVTHNP